VHFIALAAALVALAAPTQETDEDRVSPQRALERALAESVRASCPKLRYEVDRSLNLAAQEFATAVEAGRAAPTGAALGFFASLESAEPAPTAGVATIEPASLAERAVGDLYSRKCRFNRVGVAAARHQNGAVVALLTARHETDIQPIPSELPVGSEVLVSGQLPRGLRGPRLFVLRPGGSVESRDLSQQVAGPPVPENRFLARVSFEEEGEHVVEVLANGSGGPQVAAIRRVFVGIPRPKVPPPEVKMAGGESGLEAAAAAISALRAARGLPPLVRDAALDEVAQGHSEAMAEARTFAHVLPSDGKLEDRLFKLGYAYRSAGENIGLAETAAKAHEAIALSPAHLANLLDPRHRRLGLGAAEGISPEGDRGVYVTEVLAAPIVGLADPAGEVMKLIVDHRMKRSLPPLRRDRRLDLLAEREARSTALSGAPKFVANVAEQAREVAPEMSHTAAELYVGTRAEEVLQARLLESPGWTHVGIGAMYASSKMYGPGRLWVVLVLAR
jgi:uncharacterized protein YkwD